LIQRFNRNQHKHHVDQYRNQRLWAHWAVSRSYHFGILYAAVFGVSSSS
jgi:hypothetical protein